MVEFTEEFDIEQQDAGRAYRTFIEGLRTRLQSSLSHQRPVLPYQQNPPSRWFDITLRTQAHAVTLRIRLDNLYLDGYRAENPDQWFEFNNRATTHLIPGATFLGFNGSYDDLQNAGDRRRDNTNLGQQPLIAAVNQLANPNPTDRRQRARSLMVVIQMICEAIRFALISDHLADRFDLSETPTAQMIALENGWGDLSAARLCVERDPASPFQLRWPNAMLIRTVAEAVAAVGMLLHSNIPGPSRRPRSATPNDPYPIGRPLVEVFWVRIDNIDEEDPGDLYGTIIASDGLSSQYLYNRNGDNCESIHPGEHALLTGPPRVISAAGSFVISLSLWDKDSLSWDDEVVRGELGWNVYDFANTYDTLHLYMVSGQYGSSSVSYVVMSNAAEALVEVILINGDEGNPADVYGHITADITSGNISGQIELFRKGKKKYVEVRQQEAIPLSRPAVAVPIDGSLIIDADLWDHDAMSFDDEIAKGCAVFDPQINVSRVKNINGRNGQIESEGQLVLIFLLTVL
ncbi:hypothetical protein GP486_002344 [Trichoglossum hirsutum]|uniref:DUF6598 domain-containing protein n=1 Tax=Trichoglossum hirsutum TaxID=265104 RepID=A0A9P8RRS1_9PEZI|nr:hypothetical protein GP486_002344 [Trichoglossum hirsutum]